MRMLLPALLLVILGSPLVAVAESAPISTGWFSDLAVEGYDPVAYFTLGEATKGSKAFRTRYLDAEFRFTSQEHLTQFEANPDKYAPQYGGYCAWAVAQGYTAKGSAQNWRIVDDRLYLNYDDKVQKQWEQNIPAFIEQANEQWPSVLVR